MNLVFRDQLSITAPLSYHNNRPGKSTLPAHQVSGLFFCTKKEILAIKFVNIIDIIRKRVLE